jgi:hypothetical protein
MFYELREKSLIWLQSHVFTLPVRSSVKVNVSLAFNKAIILSPSSRRHGYQRLSQRNYFHNRTTLRITIAANGIHCER